LPIIMKGIKQYLDVVLVCTALIAPAEMLVNVPIPAGPAVQHVHLREAIAAPHGDGLKPVSTSASASSSLVQSWVTTFTTAQRPSFATFLDRMDNYAPMIRQKLAERGMPEELAYLPLIESGFNPSAQSPAKASGLWQFIAGTAQRYGLTVKGRVDERRDPVKETDAALNYLSDLYDRFGSWYLAAAAYNVGEGRIERAMKQVTGSTRGTDADFYAISHLLPAETQNYVPKLVAAAKIASDPQAYGFGS
jgi:membrane-bound lytic murein transglycosylase D